MENASACRVVSLLASTSSLIPPTSRARTAFSPQHHITHHQGRLDTYTLTDAFAMWSFGTTMTMADDKRSGTAPGASSASPAPEASAPSQQPLASETSDNAVTQFPPRTLSPLTSQRSLQQLGLFAAGATFMALSTLVTRRAVARKLRITRPQFYNQSNRPVTKIDSDGSFIAVEALGLATLNVIGFGIMLTGGIAWAFDISGIEDLRSLARRQFGPTGARTDEEAEREVEEWVAKVLLRKDQNELEAGKQESSTNNKS